MVLLWQSSAFLLRLGFFPQHAGFGFNHASARRDAAGSFPNTPGSGISHVQSAQLQRTR